MLSMPTFFLLLCSTAILAKSSLISTKSENEIQKNFQKFDHSDVTVYVKEYLEYVAVILNTKNIKIIDFLFDKNFEFVRCGHAYINGKEHFVELLHQHLDGESSFNYTIISAQSVFTGDTFFEITMNHRIYKIHTTGSGRLVRVSFDDCIPARHFTAQNNVAFTVRMFLERMTRSIDSKDVSIISGLFEPNFQFRGCGVRWDKEKTVENLMLLPAGVKTSFVMHSATDFGSFIEFNVSATGFEQLGSQFKFILNKNDQQLQIVSATSCH